MKVFRILFLISFWSFASFSFSQTNLLYPLRPSIQTNGTDSLFSDLNWCKTQSDSLVPVKYEKQLFPLADSLHFTATFFGNWDFLEKPKTEYIQSKLIRPLEKGKKYKLEFYVKLSRHSAWTVTDIGIVFTKAKLKMAPYYLKTEPSIRAQLPAILNGQWYKIEGEYLAKGGEEYILLGHFLNEDELLPSGFLFAGELRKEDEKWEILTDLPNHSSPEEMYHKYIVFNSLLHKVYHESMKYDKSGNSYFDMTASYDFKSFSFTQLKDSAVSEFKEKQIHIDTRQLKNLVLNPGFEQIRQGNRNRYANLDSLFETSPEIYYMNYFRRNFEQTEVSFIFGKNELDTQSLKINHPEIYYSINYFRAKIAPVLSAFEKSYYKKAFFYYHNFKPEYKKSGERDWYGYNLQKGAGENFSLKWTHPSMGIPKWFHLDSIIERKITVENNTRNKDQLVRDLNPKSGNAMAGANLHFDGHKNFLDPVTMPGYLQTKLKEPLEAGVSYYIEFYIKPDSYTRWKTRNVGALFTKKPFVLGGNKRYAPNFLLEEDKIRAYHEVLLLDVSSSMESNLEILKIRVKNYILSKPENTRFTIISFSDSHKIIARNISKENIMDYFDEINELPVGGETKGNEAIIYSYGMLSAADPSVKNSIVLFSDANFTPSVSLQSSIRNGVANHISFNIELFGTEHNSILEGLDYDQLNFVDKNSSDAHREIVLEIDKGDLVSNPLVAITHKPQFLVTDTSQLNNKNEWTKISGCFTAEGAEQYMTIGSFYYCGSCVTEEYFDGESAKELSQLAFYYFDDFYLQKDTVCYQRERIESSKPDNLVIMLDISSSMFNSKIMDKLINDLVNYVADIGRTKRITIITFGTHTSVLLKDQKISDADSLRTILKNLTAGGGTKVKEAISEGYRTINTLYDHSVSNQLVIFSDGKFKFDKATINNISFNYKEKNITLSMFQFGKFFNSDVEKIIEQNGGFYASEITESPQSLLTKITETKARQCYCPGKE